VRRRLRAVLAAALLLAALGAAAVAGNVLLLRSAGDAGDPAGQLSARLPRTVAVGRPSPPPRAYRHVERRGERSEPDD
jgi:hypothetical protein